MELNFYVCWLTWNITSTLRYYHRFGIITKAREVINVSVFPWVKIPFAYFEAVNAPIRKESIQRGDPNRAPPWYIRKIKMLLASWIFLPAAAGATNGARRRSEERQQHTMHPAVWSCVGKAPWGVGETRHIGTSLVGAVRSSRALSEIPIYRRYRSLPLSLSLSRVYPLRV